MPDTISQRGRYMRHEITFHEYYGLLVELLGEDTLRCALPGGTKGHASRTPDQWRELLEEDEHLNNVPLRRWDAADPYVRSLVRTADQDARRAITGTGGWSLSDTVCVLKETARRYARS